MCNCHEATALGFSGWRRFQDAANVRKELGKRETGFGEIPKQKGVYCIRVSSQKGEKDVDKIIDAYKQTDLYQSYRHIFDASADFFESCGFGRKWGWNRYVENPDKELERLWKLPLTEGKISCPILYIGCSDNLQVRVRHFMWLKRPANHPVWRFSCRDGS